MNSPNTDFVHSSPVLTVDDAQKTADFYRDMLSFRVERTLGDPPYYVVVRRGGVSIHFSEREDVTEKIRPCNVYILVSDVDALYEELRSKDLRTFSPPETSDHGTREFEASDLNGHFLTFGQTV